MSISGKSESMRKTEKTNNDLEENGEGRWRGEEGGGGGYLEQSFGVSGSREGF